LVFDQGKQTGNFNFFMDNLRLDDVPKYFSLPLLNHSGFNLFGAFIRLAKI